MFSASIKLANLQYLQGLQQLALSNLNLTIHNVSTLKPKLTTIPFYNLVCKLVDVLIQYSSTSDEQSKDEDKQNQHEQELQNLMKINFNIYLVDYFFRKYQSAGELEIYRQLFSFIKSWRKYSEHHQQAKLFLSLLTPERNSKQSIRRFLKYRKCILKNINQKILQEIVITHGNFLSDKINLEDALTIGHSLFAQNSQGASSNSTFTTEIKQYVSKKINQMFISLKRRLINNARVNGAVICEFFLACVEKFEEQNVGNIFGQIGGGKNRPTNNNKSKKSEKEKSGSKVNLNISKESNRENKNEAPNFQPNLPWRQQPNPKLREPLKHHNYTYLNPQNFLNPQQLNQLNIEQSQRLINKTSKPKDPKDMRYNLSFSEQYASYYSPQTSQQVDCQNRNNEHEENQRQSQDNVFEENQNYYSEEQSQSQLISDQERNNHRAERLNMAHRRRENQKNDHVDIYQNQYEDSNWQINHISEQESPMIKIRNSLTFSKQKDRQIDEKIKNKRKGNTPKNSNRMIPSTRQQQEDYSNYDESVSGQDYEIIYPRGWQNFIRTNQQTKRKLMMSKREKQYNQGNFQDQNQYHHEHESKVYQF